MNEDVTLYKKAQIDQRLTEIKALVDTWPSDLTLDQLSDLGFVLSNLVDIVDYLRDLRLL